MTTTPEATGRRAVISDMDLIADVIRAAQAPGYVLVGPSERVWRRYADQPGEIERVPDYEDTVVHQLLDGTLLTRGARQTATHGATEGPATPVLVRKDADRLARRWSSYQHPQ